MPDNTLVVKEIQPPDVVEVITEGPRGPRGYIGGTGAVGPQGPQGLQGKIGPQGPSGGVTSVAGRTGVVVLTSMDVGLGNANNTSDANKPVSTATQTALNLKANLVSPSFTGTITHSGDVVLSGTGKRITGDFSNTTIANRVMFQTSVVNGGTGVYAISNGSAASSQIGAVASSDPANGVFLDLAPLSTEARVRAIGVGSAAHVPMTFYTGGAERMRIDPSGNVGIGTSSPFNSAGYGAITTNGTTGSIYSSQVSGVETARLQSFSDVFNVQAIGASTVLTLSANGSERLRIGTSGQIGIAGANYGTSGQALVSNGSDAAPSWQTISSGLTAASTAEAQAYASDSVALTPLKMKQAMQGSNQSLAASGYQRLPGGLIIQWGKAVGVANGTSVGVTFPLAFPGLCAAAFANSIIASSGETNTKARTWNTLGMTVYNGDGTASDVHWLAIGY